MNTYRNIPALPPMPPSAPRSPRPTRADKTAQCDPAEIRTTVDGLRYIPCEKDPRYAAAWLPDTRYTQAESGSEKITSTAEPARPLTPAERQAALEGHRAHKAARPRKPKATPPAVVCHPETNTPEEPRRASVITFTAAPPPTPEEREAFKRTVPPTRPDPSTAAERLAAVVEARKARTAKPRKPANQWRQVQTMEASR